jgi:serine/threonine protein kinase/tetratricopeptide (TPR) repeat protein
MTPIPSDPDFQPMTDPDDLRAAVEGFAEDMVRRWRRGERPAVESYLDLRPELWDRPDPALELVAEELALRDEFGPPASRSEMARRFPKWAARAQAVLDYQRVLGPRPGEPHLPAPGELLGPFQVLAELGRGAHGRVFLAAQLDLADRLVVLKVGPDDGGEHLSLARLQHTHVVPLYSAHEFSDLGLRALCMPYFGGATLAALLSRIDRLPPGPRAGRDLLAALGAGAPPVETQPVRGPAWGILDRASFVGAVCWVGACLADALQYAHDRGLLHLDLKPSNVLIAADGVPMLLDFHLALPPLRAGDPAPAWLGGTPGYMPPEQEAALHAVRCGAAVPADLDARADVFALGTLLFEALARDPAGVTTGLRDILTKATAQAADRYPTAAALAADLRRHLSDLPLRGVRNRSWRERWGKWRRRRPYAPAFALLLAALAAASTGLLRHGDRQLDMARTALQAGEDHLREHRYAEAAEALRQGEAAIDGLPLRHPLHARFRAARQDADGGLAVAELHQFCERVRPVYAVETVPAGQARAVAARCREVWDRRTVIAAALADRPSAEQPQWRTNLLDVGILTAHLESRSAHPGEEKAAHRRALATLAEAEALLGPSGVLYLERARVARALGLTAEADDDARRARDLPPRTSWEHLAVARAYLGAGDVLLADAEVERCLARDPDSLWANYYHGLCCLRLGRPVPAVAAFSACVARAPRSGWCAYNRGLAFALAGDPDRAVADFDRALELDPALAPALIGRATAHQQAGRADAALADLCRAEARGVPRAEVLYRQALTLLTVKDRPAAIERLADALAADPDFPPARALLARLRHER